MNNFDMLNGMPQQKELYTSKQFKNILAGYKYQIVMRTNKYDDCYDMVIDFLENRQWTQMQTDSIN